ncbi:MAG: efflux RND transporter periplasmic adaptor subunit [Armatimonadetes bacterium]|nr:efflux RND transporter periplasmic adaptor subunit [Armatimonadota bacterium]
MRVRNFILFILILLIIFGCGKKQEMESKNLEQIYKEEGIPVKVKEIVLEEFIKELSFNATLTSLKQANASAMIGGRIEKVHVKVGDYVEKNQVLIEFPEDAPAGQFVQAKSAFELAQATHERLKNLYELGGISKQELDGAETQFKVAEANWDASQQMLKVRAPIKGYVTNLTVQETNGVEAETVLATISQTDKMKAKIWITENEISAFKNGLDATATWIDVTIKGKVSQVGLAMDTNYNAFGVDLVFDNSGNLIKSGILGEIKIQTYNNPNAIVVERKNVKSDENGDYVYVVESDTAKKRYIETGKENGNFEIISGLKTGDRVIVEGLNLVSEGVKVKIMK